MRKSIASLKGAAYIMWHAKHMIVHVLLGLMWAWMMREAWGVLDFRWVAVAVLGSLLPDFDHIYYFLTYGKNDPYARTVKAYWKGRNWKILVTFLETGHKKNTNLSFHNIHTVLVCIAVCMVSFRYDMRGLLMLFGAMTTHYVYDMAEDVILLGSINPNWFRFGRPKNTGILSAGKNQA